MIHLSSAMFSPNKVKVFCVTVVMQMRSDGVCRCGGGVVLLVFRRNTSMCGGFIGTYATYKQTQTLFKFKGILYLWEYSFLSIFYFFNVISLLYVYSLNKSDKVCNIVIPVVCVQRLKHVHAELHSKFLTVEAAVDEIFSISEDMILSSNSDVPTFA